MNKAGLYILDFSCPKHKIAFVCMCTNTKPFNKSRKFKTFFERGYGNNADVIVGSGEGIVPQEYWESYPYLTFDSYVKGKKNQVYIDLLYSRLMEFFSKHHYDVIVFNYRPTLGNPRTSAEMFKANYTGDSEIYILPTEDAWSKTIEEFKKSGRASMYFPDIEPPVLEELDNVLL